jgi:hypothetical protein
VIDHLQIGGCAGSSDEMAATSAGSGSSAPAGGELGAGGHLPPVGPAAGGRPVTHPPHAALDAGTIRRWAAEGVSQRKMAQRLNLSQFTVANFMSAHGIETLIRKPRSGEMERASAVLVEHFATHPDLKAVLALYRQARGNDGTTMKGMRAHARKLRIVRADDSVWTGAKRGAATVKAMHEAAAAELAPMLQASLNETYSLPVSAKLLGISAKRARRLARLGMVTVPPRPKVAKAPKPKPPPAPRKPNKLPATWVRDNSPRAPKPRYESVEAFLAAGGRIQVCPAAAAAVTTATLDEGRDVIRRYHEAAGETGNWKDRAKKKIGRLHFGAGA